jgi:hypothetical protein
MSTRSQATYTALGAAVLAQFADAHGVKLSASDAMTLLSGAFIALHVVGAYIDRRWPPVPTSPVTPAKS